MKDAIDNRNIDTKDKVAYKASLAVLLLAGLLVLLGVFSTISNKKQENFLAEQNNKLAQLVLDVKRVSEDNKRLSQTANNYAFCNAVILAKYTQDMQPIQIEDLDKCITTSFPNGENAPQDGVQSSAFSTLQPASNSESVASMGSQNTSQQVTQPASSANLQPTTSNPNPPAGQPAPVVQTAPTVITLNPPFIAPIKLEGCANLLNVVSTC